MVHDALLTVIHVVMHIKHTVIHVKHTTVQALTVLPQHLLLRVRPKLNLLASPTLLEQGPQPGKE